VCGQGTAELIEEDMKTLKVNETSDAFDPASFW
jgi:hypothetical protein